MRSIALSGAALVLLVIGAVARPAGAEAEWKQVEGAKVPVPPHVHPRLYLRPEHVPQLKARLEAPALRPVAARLDAMAKKNAQYKVEWDALQFLVTGDRAGGRATVQAALALLKACELPDRQDACRVTGRMMVTGAIAYDWLYPLLAPEEKKAFIVELVRLAKTQECGYPPTRQGSITGHASEAMIMRDMISAGIAVYDEFPEMYDLAAGRFFREHLPVRNWLYNGHAYHQGDSYGPHRYSWDTYPLLIFDRLGAGNVYNPEQRWVPYLYLYLTRPDGQRLRAGDTFAHSTARGRPWGIYLGALLTASYYGDPYLLGHALAQGGIGDNEALFEFLWRDPALEPKPPADLPLSRYFGPPFGWMVARTGWDENAAIVEMKLNVYNFCNHQHLDAGAFQIYYRGALAVDSGLYTGSAGKYGSPHCTNYYWRTVAHNSLLIHDPAEVFSRKSDYGNDGGQRLPNGRGEPKTLDVLLKPENGYRTGEVLARGFGPDARVPDYTLLQGDITAAYSGKVKQVLRSLVFLNLRNSQTPAALVVFDRVVSADPAFRKFWLLHTLEEPRIDGATATVDRTEHGERGRLVLNALLPAAEDLDMGKVGGPGKEYWVFGKNYANDPEPERREKSSIETAAWRIEISPKKPAEENLFLIVMQVTDRLSGTTLPVVRLDAGDRVGCRIDGPGGGWVVLFRKDGRRSEQPVSFALDGKGPYRVLVTDLAPGTWRARRAGGEAKAAEVTEEQGAAWFEGQPGAWTLMRE